MSDVYTKLVAATQADNRLSLEEFEVIFPTLSSIDENSAAIDRFLATVDAKTQWVVDRKALKFMYAPHIGQAYDATVFDRLYARAADTSSTPVERPAAPAQGVERFSPLIRDQIVYVDYPALSGGLYAMKYEMSQALYKALMGNNPTAERCSGTRLNVKNVNVVVNVVGDNLPVVCVSEIEAQQACGKLGDGFRLPTEDEWTFLAGAGEFATPDGKYDPAAINAWDFTDVIGPEAVTWGKASSNGLYNMSGNAWEWTDPDLNRTEDKSDAAVVRGGGWNDDGTHTRSSERGRYYSIYRDPDFVGVRCVTPGL